MHIEKSYACAFKVLWIPMIFNFAPNIHRNVWIWHISMVLRRASSLYTTVLYEKHYWLCLWLRLLYWFADPPPSRDFLRISLYKYHSSHVNAKIYSLTLSARFVFKGTQAWNFFFYFFCRNRNHMVPRACNTRFLKIVFKLAEIFYF